MCGIIGCIAATTSSGHDYAGLRGVMSAGVEALRQRGPDGFGIWIEDGSDGRASATAGLGHARLAVNGGASSSQPIVSNDGTLAAVINGELYDPDDRLRQRLTQKGCQFRSEGDGELVVHLYQTYGKGFTEHLRGEFAILIQDRQRNEMVAVRDRFGIKPIVYGVTPSGVWWWASHPQALFAVGLERRVDEESFWHAMSFQYTLPNRTHFHGIRQVRPGEMMTLRRSGDSALVRHETYWDLDYPPVQAIQDTSEHVHDRAFELRERLSEAISMRMRGDVPVVAHLSGGIDSCSVVNLAPPSQIARAFTVRFPSGDQYDELEIARQVAGLHQIELTVVSADSRTIVDALDKAVMACGGLAANGHLPAKYLLNTAIREAGFKVALTGEGADELLAGYPHLRMDHCQSIGRPDLAERIIGRNAASRGIMLPTEHGLGLDAVLRTLGYAPTFLRAKASLGALLRAHLCDNFLGQFDGRDAYQELLNSIASPGQLKGRSSVYQSLYLWSKTALAQNILRTLGDGCESSQAVEGRLPMLDHHLFDWCKRLPLRLLIAQTDSLSQDGTSSTATLTEKWLLRRAMTHRLPGSVVNRPKHPFIAPPLAATFATDSDLCDRIVSVAEEHPYFDAGKISETLIRVRSKAMKDPRDSEVVGSDPLWWTLLSSRILLHSSAAIPC